MTRSSRGAVLKIVVGLAFCGAALGAVWAWIAPPIHTITGLTKSGERLDGFLGRESDNVFVASAMLIGLLTMLAVIVAVLVWQWRSYRGPLMVIALWIGVTLAGATAAGTGAALAHWRYGTPDHKGVVLNPQNRVAYFTEAPPVFMGHNAFQIAVTLLLPAAVAVLTYALMTVATPRDDLGVTARSALSAR
ncbi:MAG: DUF2567 domain-containing protein [Mycobacterium sp.]